MGFALVGSVAALEELVEVGVSGQRVRLALRPLEVWAPFRAFGALSVIVTALDGELTVQMKDNG